MITPQRIVDIIEARYAELEAEKARLEESGPTAHRHVTNALECDNVSRLNELEIILARIDTDPVTLQMQVSIVAGGVIDA